MTGSVPTEVVGQCLLICMQICLACSITSVIPVAFIALTDVLAIK